jgi:hypothetical protein
MHPKHFASFTRFRRRTLTVLGLQLELPMFTPLTRTAVLAGLVVELLACRTASHGNGIVDASTNQSDATPGEGAVGGDAGATDGTVYVYANTVSTLYRVDPDTLAIQEVGDFGWPVTVGNDQMTDIAIDKTGQIIGISLDSVYRVDPSTAQSTLLSNALQGDFDGLSFVPANMLGETGDDVLVATRYADGEVFKIDPMTGMTTQIGDMGSYQSSGDLVAVAGFGIVQTVTGAPYDQLVSLAPPTFAATPIGTDTGYGSVLGLAYWKGKVYGFTDAGEFILIDPTTGAAMLVSSNGMAWTGAAVTTIAPTIQ